MRAFTVGPDDAGKRLDKWLLRELPLLSPGLAQKYIRLKRVKVNGRGAQRDTRLEAGDKLELYINDELFEKPAPVDKALAHFRPRLSIVYEDDNVLLADKRPGLIAHPDENEKVDTLLTHIRAYLYQKGEYHSAEAGAFAPVLCNRIDRFTGGIVVAAKTRAAMEEINRAIREGEIEKDYLLVARGRMTPPEGLIDNYIVKRESAKRVEVADRPQPGAQRALTRYRTLDARNDLSLVACELLTGRTHQIRAQFAHAGHPLLGDGQYGDPDFNRRYGREHQMLYAYRIAFHLKTDSGVLGGLRERAFCVRAVPFAAELFPDAPLDLRKTAFEARRDSP